MAAFPKAKAAAMTIEVPNSRANPASEPDILDAKLG